MSTTTSSHDNISSAPESGGGGGGGAELAHKMLLSSSSSTAHLPTDATTGSRERANSWSSCASNSSDSGNGKRARLLEVANLVPQQQQPQQPQQKQQQAPALSQDDTRSAHHLLLLEFQKLRDNDNLLCDAEFISEDDTVIARAHASFLYAVCAPLGRKLVSNALRVRIPRQVDANCVRKLLDYLYTNEMIRVRTERELAALRLAAEVLQVPLPPSLVTVTEQPHLVCRSTLLGHQGYVCALLLTGDDGLLVSGSRDNSIRVWDYKHETQSRVELGDIHSDRVWALLSVRNANNQERILSGSWDSTISVIDPRTWKVEKKLVGHTDWVTCLDNVDRRHFASGSADGTVRVWVMSPGADCANYQPERVLRGHRGHVYAMCSSQQALFSAGNDGFICVWDKQNWRKLERLEAHAKANIRALVWSERLSALLSGASDGKIRAWAKPSSGGNGFALVQDLDAHTDWVEALVEMSKSRIASGGRDCTVRIWKVDANVSSAWELVQSIRQHSHWVYALVFSAEDNCLISASCDMKIKVWKEEEEEKKHGE